MMIPTIFKNLMIQMMMWPLMEIIFSNNNQNNHVCRNYLDYFLGMCDPPDFDFEGILEANSRIFLRLVLLKIKKKLKFAQILMLPMKNLKLDLKLHMADRIMNLLYQGVVYFLKPHLYWLENVMNFTGISQKNSSSSVYVLQPKALRFHYFILKLPCYLQFLVYYEWQLFYCGINSITFLSEPCKEYGFADIPAHVRPRLTKYSSSTS